MNYHSFMLHFTSFQEIFVGKLFTYFLQIVPTPPHETFYKNNEAAFTVLPYLDGRTSIHDSSCKITISYAKK